MARQIITEPSRTLAEFRLLPGMTTPECTMDRISLETVLAIDPASGARIRLGIPLIASAMQAVSGPRMAVALAARGAAAAIFCSQTIEDQAAMVRDTRAMAAADSVADCLALAALNTHDYEARAAALVEAGVDVLLVDSSDGHSFYSGNTISHIRKTHPEVPVIGGNIITGEGFRFLVDAGAAAVKVGMGSGSICITQEQKGTGRGLASALIDVCRARDDLFARTGTYVPVIADGGIFTGKEIAIALAIGADTIMMGRYFSRFRESPTEVVEYQNKMWKPYWGEGSARARDWKKLRYHQAGFVEGVEGLVDYVENMDPVLQETMSMVKASMSSCGARDLETFRGVSVLELVSQLSIREGSVHGIVMR